MCLSPIAIHYDTHEHKYCFTENSNCDRTRMIWVPCGKCPECKKKRKSNYTVRARAEFQKYGCQRAFLLNLTVNDMCMNKVFPNGSLCHDEFQKFMKRLRKKLEMNGINAKIKYICGGEYGENNGRPHFHVIVYGWKPEDLKPWTSSQTGMKQYRSQFIEECWRDVDCDRDEVAIKEFNDKYQGMRQANGKPFDYVPLGLITIGEIYESTVAYVTKYVVKNSDVSKKDFAEENGGKRKPYVVFPREMLGFEWFLENFKNILSNGYCTTKYGKCSVPKNWVNKLKKLADETGNLSYINFLNYYETKRQEFFNEQYLELMKEGFKTRMDMYYEILKRGLDKLESYNSRNVKLGVSYM